MPERLVIATGLLITLSRIDCLDVMGRLPFEFLCPDAVRRELDEGEAVGHSRIAPGWLAVRELSGPLPGVALAALDLGEAAVIPPRPGVADTSRRLGSREEGLRLLDVLDREF